jgi:5-(carboxyamino)imidazole ribonucleotide mutase
MNCTGKGGGLVKVGIIMGSDSDWSVVQPAAQLLADFGITTEIVVASAHRTPDKVHVFAAGARERGVEVIIAAAGAAAHLPGVIAAYTTLPVIGIPINSTCLNGLDALLSIVQMPAGIPVATMAVNGAKNAAIFAVQIMAGKHAELIEKLTECRKKMADEVEEKAARLTSKL